MTIKKFLKKYLAWILLALCIIGVGFFFIFSSNQKQQSSVKNNEGLFQSQDSKSSNAKTSSTTSGKNQQFVEIKGAVVKPGIYPIKANTRLDEILKQAGGATSDADLKNINLAKIANDQDSFYIPRQGEVVVNAASSSDSNANFTAPEDEKNGSGLVDLNTADVTKLQTLNGIGAKKAEQIVEYRKEKGNFKKVEDLKNVSGIGDKIFESLKDQVTVNE